MAKTTNAKTEETKVLTKEELYTQAEELTKKYNDAIQNGDFNTSTALNKEIEQTIHTYTAMAREECFDNLLTTKDPMLEAIKQLTFETIRAQDKKMDIGRGKDKVTITVRTIEKKDKEIDILKLHKEAKNGIGKQANWFAIIEKFNMLLTAQTAMDLGINPKSVNDSYAMCDIARQIELGKTPTSKTNLLKTLQTAINAMVGEEYKATSHDVKYLLNAFSKKATGRALTIACASHKNMRHYMMEICHHIIVDKPYALKYPTVSK